jgi:hypothetical protein
VLRTRGYARQLLLSLVMGVPITVACFFFVGLQHELRHRVRESLPEAAGCDAPVGRADGGADRDSDHAGPRAGRRTERWTGRHTALRTLACAAAVGVCVTAYALLTGRSPVEAALSGEGVRPVPRVRIPLVIFEPLLVTFEPLLVVLEILLGIVIGPAVPRWLPRGCFTCR